MTAHVRWPASRFYWAVLETGSLPKGSRITPEQLGYLFEAFVPEPLEVIHAVYARASEETYVACALPARVLRKDVPEGALTLAPESRPPWAPKIEPARMNLLTGAFEPAAVRRARRRWYAQLSGLAATSALLLAIGIERRVSAIDAQRREIEAAAGALYRGALGYRESRLPPELQLQAELRALRQTRRSDVPVVATRDAAVELSRVLALWPDASPARTESVEASADGIQLRAQVASNDDAQRIAQALAAVPGWRQELPGVQPGGGGVELRLQWTREERSR